MGSDSVVEKVLSFFFLINLCIQATSVFGNQKHIGTDCSFDYI